MRFIRPWLLSILLIGGIAAAVSAQAPPPPPTGGIGDLLVAPTRVVFDGRKRSAELNLANIGQARATYRVSLVRMEMDEIGAFMRAGQDSARAMGVRSIYPLKDARARLNETAVAKKPASSTRNRRRRIASR